MCECRKWPSHYVVYCVAVLLRVLLDCHSKDCFFHITTHKSGMLRSFVPMHTPLSVEMCVSALIGSFGLRSGMPLQFFARSFLVVHRLTAAKYDSRIAQFTCGKSVCKSVHANCSNLEDVSSEKLSSAVGNRRLSLYDHWRSRHSTKSILANGGHLTCSYRKVALSFLCRLNVLIPSEYKHAGVQTRHAWIPFSSDKNGPHGPYWWYRPS